MAEVRKKQKVEKYNIDEMVEKKEKKKKSTKKEKKTEKKKEPKVEKKGIWNSFMTFCHGVKSEFQKVHWPSKENMVKYSIAVILFIIFCSLFFYIIDILFAAILAMFS